MNQKINLNLGLKFLMAKKFTYSSKKLKCCSRMHSDYHQFSYVLDNDVITSFRTVASS